MKMFPGEKEKWYNSSAEDDFFSAMANLRNSFVDCHEENELLGISAVLSPVSGVSPNTGPQVNSEKSIPPRSRAMMSTSEIQNYDGSSHYLSGYNTLAVHCGQKRQVTAHNLEVGVSIFKQKYRRVDNISFPHHRRNSPPISNQSNHTESDQGLGNYPTAEENQEKETHFEEQPTEIQRNNPVRQAIVETIEDHNIPNAITDHDVVDHPTHMGAQFSLASTSTQPLSSFSSIEKIKLDFDNLIALPLKVLMDPDNETSMKKVLVILKDNLSLFSEKQQGQILELCVDFPAFVLNWREWHSQSQIYRQQAETDRDLAGKDRERIRVRYEALENKEKELMRQLDEVHKQKAEIAKRRTEKSKLTKDLKEKEAHRNKEEKLKRIATEKLNKLSAQWAERQSFFT